MATTYMDYSHLAALEYKLHKSRELTSLVTPVSPGILQVLNIITE